MTSKVVYAPMNDVNDFAKEIVHAIHNAKVKTATPTRAQNSIQVRVSWKDLSKKPRLGYMSLSAKTAEAIFKSGKINISKVKIKEFIMETFRTHQWAHDLEAKATTRAIGQGACLQALDEELTRLGVFESGTVRFTTFSIFPWRK